LTPYYSEQNIDLVKGARALSLSFLGASLSNKKIPFNRDLKPSSIKIIVDLLAIPSWIHVQFSKKIKKGGKHLNKEYVQKKTVRAQIKNCMGSG